MTENSLNYKTYKPDEKGLKGKMMVQLIKDQELIMQDLHNQIKRAGISSNKQSNLGIINPRNQAFDNNDYSSEDDS